MKLITTTQAWRLIAITMLSVVGLTACGAGNSAAEIPPDEAANIRIANETGFDLERIWIGGGTANTFATFNTRFVDVDNGDVSVYLPVEPVVENYNIVNITTEESVRFNTGRINPHELVGLSELRVGEYYTITIGEPDENNDNRLALVNVTVDDPP